MPHEGMIFASDSRTHAGVNAFAKFCKMTVFERRGNRVIVLLSSGNLAGTQAVISVLTLRCADGDAATNLMGARTMFDVVRLVSDAMRDIENRDGQMPRAHPGGCSRKCSPGYPRCGSRSATQRSWSASRLPCSAVLGALSTAIPASWRPGWIGWWLAIALLAAFAGDDFTNAGHLVALIIGMSQSVRFRVVARWTLVGCVLLAIGAAFSYLVLANEMPLALAPIAGLLGALTASATAEAVTAAASWHCAPAMPWRMGRR